MARRTIPHGGVVACDVEGCGERFTTYSVVSLARTQAAQVGWSRIKATSALDEKGGQMCSEFGNKKVDLCPTHRPVPITKRVA